MPASIFAESAHGGDLSIINDGVKVEETVAIYYQFCGRNSASIPENPDSNRGSPFPSTS